MEGKLLTLMGNKNCGCGKGLKGPKGDPGPDPAWGNIAGDILDQTDLNAVFAKIAYVDAAKTQAEGHADDKVAQEVLDRDAAINNSIDLHVASNDPHGDRAYTDSLIPTFGTAALVDTGTAAGNVPVLDGSGILPASILPALAITDTYEVASQAAMLALAAERGDIAIRTDLNKCYVLAAEPATTLANWKELKTPTGAVLAVAGLTGTITAAALKAALATTLADVLAAGNTSGANDLELSQMLRFVYAGRNADVSASGITANRNYGLPDKSGVFALTSDVDAKANKLITINAQTGTTYTTVLSDGGGDKLLRQTAATATTCTIPPNSSVAYPVGTVLSGVQAGAGQVTLTPGSGVTLNSRGGALKTAGQYAPWTAIKVATDTWLVSGDLTT